MVEYLSYEGVFAATNSHALGITSSDIGVRELGNEPAGKSLQRISAGTWTGPLDNTFSNPSNGIQNGSPDGMALVDAAGRVVEFLSYEGTFTAVGGPADGVVSTDIIAQEPSNRTRRSASRCSATRSTTGRVRAPARSVSVPAGVAEVARANATGSASAAASRAMCRCRSGSSPSCSPPSSTPPTRR